ncbi:hypothetical protein CLU79DRAFT_836759 [Phycomyces nitens]|nr:hypothetical protein CLU79DRAFT_836759 [Phycomyces nitens]
MSVPTHLQHEALPLKVSCSADSRRLSPARCGSPPYPDSDGNLSTSSNGSLKRRRGPGRPSKKELKERETWVQKKDTLTMAQEKLKDLRLPSAETNTFYHFRAGDQVEALKCSEYCKEWYCARVVQVSDDKASPCVFVHYEGWPPDHADWVSLGLVRTHTSRTPLRFGPLGRESERSWKDYASFYYTNQSISLRQYTGLVQDRRMSLHSCPCHSAETIHPERPDRIASILQAFHAQKMLRYFRHIHAREATLEELMHVHTATHVRNYTSTNTLSPIVDQHEVDPNPRPLKITSIAALLNSPTESEDSPPSPSPRCHRHGSIVGPTRGVGGGVVVEANQDDIQQQHRRFSTAATTAAAVAAAASNNDAADLAEGVLVPVSPPGLVCKMTCGELGIAVDTTFHPLHSSLSARVAAGALLNLVTPIVEGQLHNGFALIRPPGHHAEDDNAMGFCFFNNVAVAVSNTLEKYPLKIRKILVIDWDVHHGNGTQKIFYDNPNVLYISLHRWEQGKFYPFSGAPDECGEGAGLGRNVNISFNESLEKPKPMGDTEFIAAFYHIILPISRQFLPDMVLMLQKVTQIMQLGGYKVSPRGFALMTKMVKDLAEELCDGRLVMTLEGGYELQPLANSALASVVQLLPDHIDPDGPLEYKHSLNAIKPNQGAVESLNTVIEIQRKFWDLPEYLFQPGFRFHLPVEWRATDSISTRPRRDKRPRKVPVVEGY